MVHMTTNTEHLIRAALWSAQLKEQFEDELFAMQFVDWLSDFPDGDLLHIPSIGQAVAQKYEEGQAVTYSDIPTGDFTFRITEYLQSGHAITNKMKQDSYLSSQLMSQFVPKEHRAIMKVMEADALRIGPDRQTPNDPNSINGAAHRLVGSAAGDTLGVADFARARYALQKANVPMNNLVAIVDPSVEFTFNTQPNVLNFLSNNQQWNSIVGDGIGNSTKFRFNVYGFDVYVSQNLKSGISETINTNAVTNGVANLFFSAASGVPLHWGY